MNTCVKQKKLDEEGGRVGQWGKGIGVGDGEGELGVERWAPVSDVCLACQAWSLLCMCVRVPVCVCLCIRLSHSHKAQYWGVKVGTLEGGRHIQTNHWSFWQRQELSVLLMSRSLALWVAGLFAAVLPACIRASPGVCISKVCHCNWLTSLRTPTSIWPQADRRTGQLTDR